MVKLQREENGTLQEVNSLVFRWKKFYRTQWWMLNEAMFDDQRVM